ncbi:MAG: aconitate hydratase AcnA, partial [Thermoplasmata archaeon]|nr:aconitate hydratase AcnA [Thermoplasmata archaeon]
LWDTAAAPQIDYDELVEVDLAQIVPTVAGPKNPEESVPLSGAAQSFRAALAEYRSGHPARTAASTGSVHDGKVVIAAITSCTNTSNPAVMIGAGLIAERALALGLHVPAGVKTSLAPGSKVVTDYLRRAGLLVPLASLGFDVVGYGCTTCIGNSGPLDPPVEKAVRENDLFVGAVLSGNRNFEARIHNLVRANYLASPMLVVAYALAGRLDIDLTREPLGQGHDGRPVYLKDLWPPSEEIRRRVEASLDPEMFRKEYSEITVGDAHWEHLAVPGGSTYPWEATSTYLRNPPYFAPITKAAESGPSWLTDARALVVLGDRVSTDHISPAGEITPDGPAGEYLREHGVEAREFNTFGARRGNHEVMVRGTFANLRLKNELVSPKEGGYTQHLPDRAVTSIFRAAELYRVEGIPLVVLAGASYGQGSSRDWAAKGPMLLGVRAVIAESFERIHRSNLVGMGVVPFDFASGEGWKKLGLSGRERFTFHLPEGGLAPHAEVVVTAADETGREVRRFHVRCRIDSSKEMEYYRSGGLLPFVLNRLAA